MHAGEPWFEGTVAVMTTYPQVYGDLGVLDWVYPPDVFYEYLQRLIRRGLDEQLMFGSDQMVWPQMIGQAIAAVESAPGLTEGQKRDILYGAPKGYHAAAYGRDFKVFLSFARESAPDMLILGPGSIGEAAAMGSGFSMLRTEDMLAAAGRGADAFSYHYYGAVSKRCSFSGAAASSPRLCVASLEEGAKTRRR